MKFCIIDEKGYYVDRVIEINTFDELKAFANGGTGRIEIGFNEIDYDGKILKEPIINPIKRLSRNNEEE